MHLQFFLSLGHLLTLKDRLPIKFLSLGHLLSEYSPSRIGFQSRADEEMKTIPFLETVAGEALSILSGSNTIWKWEG